MKSEGIKFNPYQAFRIIKLNVINRIRDHYYLFFVFILVIVLFTILALCIVNRFTIAELKAEDIKVTKDALLICTSVVSFIGGLGAVFSPKSRLENLKASLEIRDKMQEEKQREEKLNEIIRQEIIRNLNNIDNVIRKDKLKEIVFQEMKKKDETFREEWIIESVIYDLVNSEAITSRKLRGDICYLPIRNRVEEI